VLVKEEIKPQSRLCILRIFAGCLLVVVVAVHCHSLAFPFFLLPFASLLGPFQPTHTRTPHSNEKFRCFFFWCYPFHVGTHSHFFLRAGIPEIFNHGNGFKKRVRASRRVLSFRTTLKSDVKKDLKTLLAALFRPLAYSFIHIPLPCSFSFFSCI